MTKILARDATRRCKKLAEWPDADRALWEASLEPGDIVDPGGARARFAHHSNRKLVAGYGRWLQGLDHVGQLDPGQHPGARITPERVTRYIGALSAHNGTQTLISRLNELHDMALVMDPGQDWSWTRRAAVAIRARHVPARAKAPRLVGADELYAAGFQLMAHSERSGSTRRQACHYRDGLAIALLAARPLRRRNLAGLQIDQSFVRQGSGWWIDIPAAETKTKVPIRMPLGAELSAAVDHYLDVHRPVLEQRKGYWCKDIGAALWVSSHGSPMTEMALYDRIMKVTEALLGRSINPHLFRDCAATSIAVDDPEHVFTAASLLGHTSLKTVERYYNQASNRNAAQSYQKHLIRLRTA